MGKIIWLDAFIMKTPGCHHNEDAFIMRTPRCLHYEDTKCHLSEEDVFIMKTPSGFMRTASVVMMKTLSIFIKMTRSVFIMKRLISAFKVPKMHFKG